MEGNIYPATPTVDEVFKMFNEQKKLFVENTLRAVNREGMEAVLTFLSTSDFYSAPSSMNNHSNYQNGLLDHSILVYSLATKMRDAMIAMDPSIAQRIPQESVVVSTLLHDICKCYFYIASMKNKKNENGEWVSYVGYTIQDRFPIGHGEKSVIMLQDLGLKMTPEEMLAIRYHMGCWDGSMNTNDVRYAHFRAIEMAPLIVLLQNADYMASLVFERKITN